MKSLTSSHIANTLQLVQRSRRLGQKQDGAAVHPFPARMPVALAAFLIDQLSEQGDTVLDPMAGSGTTLIAARALGRRAMGFDIDPLSVNLATAVTATHDLETLRDAGARALQKAVRALARPPLVERELQRFDEAEKLFLDYWVPTRSQRELAALRAAIESEPNERSQLFLWLVFSSLIIAKSAGATYALDLAHSRPHKRLDKQITWPIETWESRLERAIKGLRFTSDEGSLPDAIVRLGDARRLDIADSSIDLVLTSPPYRQAIDYMRVHKFALVWMGHALSTLTDLRSRMIGSERAMPSPDGLPVAVEDILTNSVPLSSYRGVVRRYVSDLQSSLREIHRVLMPRGIAVVVVGPSIISSSHHDAPDLMQQLATAAGLDLVAVVERRLNVNRRSLPAPNKVAAGNSLRKRMRREFLVALRRG